jgi:hypothetical protein
MTRSRYVDSGQWWEAPPREIEPGTSVAWGSFGSKGFMGVSTGTCGAVLYRGGAVDVVGALAAVSQRSPVSPGHTS